MKNAYISCPSTSDCDVCGERYREFKPFSKLRPGERLSMAISAFPMEYRSKGPVLYRLRVLKAIEWQWRHYRCVE